MRTGWGIVRTFYRRTEGMSLMSADAKGEQYKGRAKEALGDFTGNEDLKREGKIDRTSGEAKEKFNEAADKVRDALTGKGDKK